MTTNPQHARAPYRPADLPVSPADRHLAWLLAEWRRRSIAAGWPQPAAWLTPGAKAAVGAFFRPGRIRGACAQLAADRADADIPLLAALSDLDLLFLTAVGRGASDSVVSAYIAARHARLPVVDGYDQVCELPGEALLRRHLMRRAADDPADRPLVVAVEPQIGAYPAHERLRLALLVAQHVMEVFGTPAHLLDDGRLAVVAERQDALPALVRLAGLAPYDPILAATGHAAVPTVRASVVTVLRDLSDAGADDGAGGRDGLCVA
ncbi:hypothetical protein [Yinghuangia seranimata]|uniref:hypothetical protein n=1 Tax=Yinghuangia seranimata TaxID=408067 RepID=UPI00248B0E64|nr:hypothetical protein [Yinghuangia seranimata]MDI2132650.1 hypothetical protein [Yinghuangia seranimata]